MDLSRTEFLAAHQEKGKSDVQLLIADDSRMNRRLIANVCHKMGYHTIEADNGREALLKLEENAIDVAILDILMPGKTGAEILDLMKADRAYADIPVIIVSSVDDFDTIIRCIEQGADDYLSKPFNKTLLRARIKASVERKKLHDAEKKFQMNIEIERRKVDSLLRVIFPDPIIAELKESSHVRPRVFDNVAVLFCDIAGFTSYCDNHPLQETVEHLQSTVERFEKLAFRYDLEKIKTIGDAFMAASGLLKRQENPVERCIECGLEMLAELRQWPPFWKARIGIDAGSVMGGIIGHNRYLFDIWGDTVNMASRMEHHGAVNHVNLSEKAWLRVCDHYRGERQGDIEVKGKGKVNIFVIRDRI